jgi:hypothetical protein
VVQYCALVSDWKQAYNACEKAVALIPKSMLRSFANSDKKHMLSQVAGFACDTAAVAIHAGEGAIAALNLLEQGRSVLATSLDEMRPLLAGTGWPTLRGGQRAGQLYHTNPETTRF